MQNQAEYRENAMRDRHQTGDWFSHSSSPSNAQSPSAAGVRSSPVKKQNQESEAWFDYSPSSANNGGNRATPTRQNGNQSWFRQEATGAGTSQQRDLHPIGVSEPKLKPRRISDERRAREAAAGNPNEWFRHDHKAGEGLRATPGSGTKKHISTKTAEEALWFAQNGREQSNGSTDPTAVSKTRHSGHDANLYYNRDKTGSGADWFPHEHQSNADDQNANPAATARGVGRMNIESPEWFSHENPPSAASPRPSASQEVRKMQARASGDEVRQILRVDENLQKNQPPAVAEQLPEVVGDRERAPAPQVDHYSPRGTSGGEVNRYTESLIEKFQRQTELSSTSATDDKNHE